jgi:hypothetical protein
MPIEEMKEADLSKSPHQGELSSAKLWQPVLLFGAGLLVLAAWLVSGA